MHKETERHRGRLYIVATPIGNLEDITLRALRILKEVDCIAAEDTRHTKKLLNHYGITTRLISYYREQEMRRAEEIIQLLDDGQHVAVVTDAGTPGIADPGAIVVQKARQKQHKIIPLPGASALTTALCCAGIRDGRILFQGFAPAKRGKRRKVLQTLAYADYYSVFYETPRRIDDFIHDAYEILGDIQVFIARELTKSYEELHLSTLRQYCRSTDKTHRGEYVVILAPAEVRPTTDIELDEFILWYRRNSKLSLKDSSKKLAGDLGIPRSKIYKRALELWSADETDKDADLSIPPHDNESL